MSQIAIATELVVEFLTEGRPHLGDIDARADLIESRVLDSLRFVEFLYFIEERTGQEISLEDVSPEDFRTVEAIVTRFFNEEVS
jgi:acyl carrier protein